MHSEFVEFAKFSGYVVIMAHQLACFFFLWPALFVSECSEQDATAASAVGLSIGVHTDCTPRGSWRDVENTHNMEPWHQYTLALYWSVTTVTTIGFGDITPILPSEVRHLLCEGSVLTSDSSDYYVGAMQMWFAIFAEMFGMAFFALLVDHVVRLSDVLDDKMREANERKNDVVQVVISTRGVCSRYAMYCTSSTTSPSLASV